MKRVMLLLSLFLTLLAGGQAQTPTPSPTPAPKECSAPVLKTSDLDRRTKILAYPHPHFSDAQVQKHRGQVIILRGIFCGSGKVTDIRVVHSVSADMDEEAIKTARKIKFTPAQKDGQNVSQWLQLEYRITVTNIWP